MNALSPNTRFTLFGGTFKIDCDNGSTIRFHREEETYDVWEMQTSWLLDKMQTGRLKILLGNTTKENAQ